MCDSLVVNAVPLVCCRELTFFASNVVLRPPAAKYDEVPGTWCGCCGSDGPCPTPMPTERMPRADGTPLRGGVTLDPPAIIPNAEGEDGTLFFRDGAILADPPTIMPRAEGPRARGLFFGGADSALVDRSGFTAECDQELLVLLAGDEDSAGSGTNGELTGGDAAGFPDELRE